MTIARTPAISRDRARTLSARVLDDAMHALGIANTELADHLGCDESLVRRMRKGGESDPPLTGAVILRLPANLRAAVLHALADDGTPVATSRESQACDLQCAAAGLIAEIAQALADGRVTVDEVRRKIAPALARLDGAAAPLRNAGGDA